jgi:dipeptidyl aminopeptidase/acylaminoacyl peptidase
MRKVMHFFTVLALLIVVSCVSQQQNPSLETPSLHDETSTFTLNSTEPPSPANSNEATLTIMPVPVTNIPQNALIVYSGGNSIDLIPAIGGTSIPIIESNRATYYDSPSWSPTGDKIAFALRGNGISTKIYTINPDGSGLHLLRNNTGDNPIWSPDGEQIAYTTDQGLYVTGVDNPSLQQLAKAPIGFSPAWSPDGRKLALLGDSTGFHGPYKIFLIDSDGKNLHPITGAVAGVSRLSWSPDGNKIAFRSFEGCGDINVLYLKTGVITNLTNTPDDVDLDPAWSPDGNYIAFSKAFYTPCAQDKVYAYHGDNIYIMRANGQDVTQLINAKGDQPSWWPTLILKINWKYSVTKAGSNLNVRESPSTSAKSLARLPQGAVFTVLDGPVDADNYKWWHIRSDDGIEGWCVDVSRWFIFKSTGSTAP